MKIILGSSSIPRRSILEEAGYKFSIVKPDIDEKAIRIKDYYKLPLLIAQEKSKAVQIKVTEPAIIITADQVVVWNGELREKPSSEKEARAFLESYSKNPHIPIECVNGLVVLNTKTGKTVGDIHISKIFFNPFPDEVIAAAIQDGNILNYAGGFSVDVFFSPFIKRIEGGRDSILGMPLDLLVELIYQVS